MWQRVQTLWFAVATGLMIALACGDVATIMTAGSDPETVKYMQKLQYAVLIVLALAANLVALFCWGHRPLQIRLAGFASVILLALQVWLAVDYFTMPDEVVFKWTMVFPVVALIFDLLAIKGIYADELLVHSASRLRASRREKELKERKKTK